MGNPPESQLGKLDWFLSEQVKCSLESSGIKLRKVLDRGLDAHLLIIILCCPLSKFLVLCSKSKGGRQREGAHGRKCSKLILVEKAAHGIPFTMWLQSEPSGC
jgi:hypothetical protein